MIDIIKKYEDEGIVTTTKHPIYPYWLCNYTQKCQYEKLWDKNTITYRGLVTTEDEIVARPFCKFFNFSELQGLNLKELYGVDYSILNQRFEALNKEDGSLIIRFFYKEWESCTKGSFQSTQAEASRRLFKDKYKVDLNPEYTYLFEYVGPTNQIVLFYKEEELILLGVIHTKTGKELTYDEVTKLNLPFKQPKRYYLHTLYAIEKELNRNDFEGFVLNFNGFRCKMKTSTYVELHRIMANFSEKNVFEAWSLDQDYVSNSLINDIPDEFYDKIKNLYQKYNTLYSQIEREYKNVFENLKHLKRKDFAEIAKQYKYPHLLFNLYSGKDNKDALIKCVKHHQELSS